VTLRLRLVVALVVLVTVGLGVFGAVTYALYARSQYDRLDDQIRASVGLVSQELREEADLGHPFPGPGGGQGDDEGGQGDGGDGRGGYRDHPAAVAPPGTYAELWRDGEVLSSIQLSEGDDLPALPDDVAGERPGHLSTVGSVDGDTRWRVLVDKDPGFGPETIVVAFPTSDVRSSLSRLIAIEAAAAAGLLALVALGAWLILRRGLRPLERMAATAGTISAAGELATRVEPADDRSEVGQLGLALNTMLGKLEVSFAEQEATERRLRQFLADASHELRTPLTSIQGFAELFRLGAGHDQVDLAVTMRRIEEESARMKDLVDDLLTLARLDQTRPVERVEVDLAVLAADACSDAVAAQPDRPVTLDAPEPVVVHGDRDLLRQAIANLVGNALRHTPAGRPIEVTAATGPGGQATVVVRDHGPGLDEAALAHAFDRFWQADPSRSEEGAGLGLAIVAGIAAEHGGGATVANVPPADGGGARFTLTLPR
jgi:two-component system OmpR family sensor kinase